MSTPSPTVGVNPVVAAPTNRRTATAALLLTVVVLAWGLNWTVTKILVASIPPLWTSAMRSTVAAVVLLGLLAATRQFVMPRRGDLPIVLVVALFHMVGFSTLVATGLTAAPVGRSIVLGYATPIWVIPAACLFLGETITWRKFVGVVLALLGLGVLFRPGAVDWSAPGAPEGHALILAAAACWAVSIVYSRHHRWISTPFQLVFWQALLAALLLGLAALLVEGLPVVRWNAELVLALTYSGVIGTALAYWAMAVVSRRLPAGNVSLGVLATPVVGIAMAAVLLGEPVSLGLVAATALVVLGVALGTVARS